MKKKVILTAASAILTVGILAACGDNELDEPTLGEESEVETEMDMDGFDDAPEADEGVEELPELNEDTEEFDAELETEEEDIEEFDSELETEFDDSDDNGL
ncbi:hypothetical protein N0O92_05785 [Alkalihalobacillus sp. MEB130]|uniref:hypothetical protein n=1 Tax=Alkalihalobacillus sp. MEB130 TaxID=2976704 RepID=UPI0028DF3B55|nr:hypothetical protein [Alkalihalobacillus sp. MEB130]MDT8859737.1 hypothetical protein [Alkalihalobacillus sp. MEB130]